MRLTENELKHLNHNPVPGILIGVAMGMVMLAVIVAIFGSGMGR